MNQENFPNSLIRSIIRFAQASEKATVPEIKTALQWCIQQQNNLQNCGCYRITYKYAAKMLRKDLKQ